MFRNVFIYSVLTGVLLGCGSQPAKDIKPEDLNGTTYLSCENYKIVWREDKTGLKVINRKGQIVTQHDSTRMSRLLPNGGTNLGFPGCDDTIPISLNKQYGYLLPSGKLFANRLFENIYGIKGDILAYRENEKWGLINRDGDIVVLAKYEQMRPYGKDYFKVYHKENIFLIDHFGTRFRIEDDPLYSVKYDVRLAPRDMFLKCDDNLKRASKDGKWGIVDSKDSIIIPIEFDAISCPDENLNTLVPNSSRTAWCEISKPYKLPSTETCQTSYFPSHPGTHYLHERLSNDWFESSLLWTQAYLEYGEGRLSEPPKFIGDGVMGHGVLLPNSLYSEFDKFPVKLD